MRSIALAAAMAVTVLGLLASPAFSAEPQRQTFGGSLTIVDYFSGSPESQCTFPVTGHWDFVGRATVFLDEATGNPVRVVMDIEFNGTFSNPLSGKSVPDSSHHLKITDNFAADGSLIEEVTNESRDDRYLHAAFHVGIDAAGNVLFDNGRDWFLTASRFIDIAPLCAALS